MKCPYRDCTFTGTLQEVDDHRATGIHNDEPQAGSNEKARPEHVKGETAEYPPVY
jgi:hypothetical protein